MINVGDSLSRLSSTAVAPLSWLATIVTPDTLLAWHRRPIANKYDGSDRRKPRRPHQFQLGEDTFQIDTVEEQWRSPDAALFSVRTIDGKYYLLRYDEAPDQWTLQSDFDGAELFTRSIIELVTVDPASIREAESRITACDQCRPSEFDILFDSILADVLDKHGAFEFVLAEVARCPKCRSKITEKTLVEPQGGIEVERLVEQ